MIGFIGSSFFFNHTHNQSSAETFFLSCQRLVPFSFYDWNARGEPIENIRFLAMNICEPHRKHCFPYCCIYSALHSNGSYPIVACVFIFAYCCRLYPAMVCLPRNCLRKNVFIEPLPSNGQMHHNIRKLIVCLTENTAPELKSPSG
jgi:hypothetical protein